MSMNNFQAISITERATALGFFPVDIDFSEESWELITQTARAGEERAIPALWMRHIPAIGDAIVFQHGTGTYRGTVIRRGFEAIPSDELDLATTVYLYLDPVERCYHPVEGSVWFYPAQAIVEGNDAT